MTDTVQEWVASFPVADATRKLDTLERRRAEVDAEIAGLRTLLDALGAAPEAPAENGNGQGIPDLRTLAVSASRPKGMEAVETVMASAPERTWKRSEINAELVGRGWLAEGESGRKTLGSILYRMSARGRVVNSDPGSGLYRLPNGAGVAT